jgi:hypothetical protein
MMPISRVKGDGRPRPGAVWREAAALMELFDAAKVRNFTVESCG